ncbi:carbohydrate-binding protein [Hymenobacter chitinivorans]|uniref:Putative secreted protein (Por secretion system target) n=1 Tax=Hymenobacter chitinivorans DSM 11115 TaxID=1121954 RepID=A0A2M9BAF6_9BACT|nr:carbohydrate-binding protein [Hymenobacter chitinivorans]PJJ54915.1 putative secreted protein (Por secretion system target) [Hymenobacter chitinivorans DSM 11115]
MKKTTLYGLSALLLGGALSTQAQERATQPAYSLGSSQELVRQLEVQAATAEARRAVPTVQLRVSASQAFVGKVNYREDLAASGEYVVGEIQNVPGSSFLLRIEGGSVKGNIIFRQSRQAYSYSADARGNVLVQPADINKLICIDYNQPVGYRNPAPQTDNTASKIAVISLQSLPGARGCVMLDFDGQYVSGTPWNNGNPINAAPSGMTDAAIQEFWELVSEDYRPFSMNVTTDEAVFNSYPKTMRMRCIITPTNTAAPGAGGVAYLTSFNWNDDTPCWVFMTSPKAGGEAASHEVGHTLGLSHDGRLNPKEEYYDARSSAGNWAPIMGAGYYKPVTHWSRGEYASASQTQDDLAIMSGATYNVGYRNDDHSNSISGATNLARNGNSVSGAGIIERTSDQDYFAFSTSGGTVSLNLSTVSRHGDLDIVGRLFTSTGAQIGTFDTQGSLSTTLSANLGAGTYYLQIDGTSYGNPTTDGYSDYASLGTFSISGTVPAPVSSGVATVYKDCNYTGTAVALPAGDYTLAALQSRGILNDDISSLTVNGGYQVVLYENDNFSGAALTLTASNSCLVNNPLSTGNWNDKATSLRVQPAASSFSVTLQAEAASVNNGMTAETTTDVDGGQNMGYVDAGDYLVWNGINVPTTGSYLIEYRVASPSGGTISSDLNAGALQFGNSAIPATGGWQTWTTVLKTVTINAGTYNFGIYAQTGGWNLNWVRITKTGAARLAGSETASVAQAAPTLEIYPNPVTDQLRIRADQSLVGSEYQILDAWGKVVASGSAAAGQLNVAALQPGMYTLRLVIEGKVQPTKRFVK